MIKINDLNFCYKNSRADAGLSDITLHIKRGETVLLCGESGCGKTTLTRLINGLIPHYHEGEVSGRVLVHETDVAKASLYELSYIVGSVFQNPRSQFFTVDTDSELVFGCENQGLPAEEIKNRREQTIAFMDIKALMGRSIFDLSGGEKQKLACASVWTAMPAVLVLDEPSANLDDRAIRDLRKVLEKCKAAGITIVIAEHRLHYIAGLADRVLYMKAGRIEKEFTRKSFLEMSTEERERLGLRACGETSVPLQKTRQQGPRITFTGFSFQYKRNGRGIHAVDIEIPEGAVTALTGHNGAGKSTLVRCMCGLERKAKGKMSVGDKKLSRKERRKSCYLVMQDVNHQLFCESVLDEVLISMPEPVEAEAYELLEQLDLKQFAEAHPLSLSGGQKQRVAIACAAASKRPVIFFDEPTSGLDLRHMYEVAACLRRLAEDKRTILVTTHDKEFIAACGSNIIHMEAGTIN